MPDAPASWRAFVDEVRDRSPLLDVVSADARSAGRSGRIDWFFSPFRTENTASFAVYSDQNRFHDFGGDKTHGDVFSYVMRRDSCDFKTSLAWLASRAGIAYSPTPKDIEETSLVLARRGVTTLQTRIQHLLHELLPSLVREHLRSHYGLSDETIDLEQVGWCPAGFFETASDLGTEEELLSTGYFLRTRSGIVPLFTHRIVFPYWSRGHVVYAIGRLHAAEGATLEDHEKAKYRKLLTASDKHDYVHKSVHNEWFWGEDHLRSAREWAVFTEGITDAISLVQAGVPAASFVTTQHREADAPKVLELTRHLGRVYVCNDADILPDGTKPGLRGALKIASLLTQSGKDVRIVVLPKPEGARKIDVNEYLRDEARAGRDPGESFRALLTTAKTVPEVLLDEIPEGLDPISLEKRLAEIATSYPQMGGVTEAALAKSIAKRFELPKAYFSKLLRSAQREAAKTEVKVAPAPGPRRDRLRGEVQEDVGYYYIRGMDSDESISNFSMTAKAIVEHETGDLVLVDVCFRSGQKNIEWTVPRTAWNSAQSFRGALPSLGMAFTGNNEHVQGIRERLLTNPVPRIRSVPYLGVHLLRGKPQVVAHGEVWTEDGLAEPRELAYVGRGSPLERRIVYKQTDEASIRALAAEAFPKLLRVNRPGVAIPVLAHCFATPWKNIIQKAIGHFPILSITGQRGSGKTSLITRVFWRLHGVTEGDPFSCTDTPFVILRLLSSTNAAWVVFDEFRPSDMGNKIDGFVRHMRRAYSGDIEARGKADQSVTEYPLVAPLVVMGEAPFDDLAMHERIISVIPSPIDVRNPDFARTFHELEAMPLEHLALPYLQWVMRSWDRAEGWLMESLDLAKKNVRNLGSILPPRVLHNLGVHLFGIRVAEEWAKTLGVGDENFPEEMGKEAFADLCSVARSETDVRESDDAFDLFLSAFSNLASRGLLQRDIDFYEDGNKVSIAVESVIRVYLTEQKKAGLGDVTQGTRSIYICASDRRRELGELSYIVSVRDRVRFPNGMRPSCIVLDKTKIPDKVGFSVSRQQVPEKKDSVTN